MTNILGRKRYNIDQPSANPKESIAGSGVLVLIRGTEFPTPTLDGTYGWSTTTNFSSPALDTPTFAWS